MAVPVAIDMVCPSCRKPVTFTPTQWDHQSVFGFPYAVRCPRCSANVTLIRLGSAQQDQVRLFIDDQEPGRGPVAGLNDVPADVLPQKLRAAYLSALSVLAIGEAEATAVTCRRVLEGVTGRLLSDPAAKGKTLAQRIRALADEQETLAAPLIDLSDSLRRSGNLGAHFDEDGPETSVKDAEQMVDLLDLLFTYLYVLPQQIHEFKISVLGESEPPPDPE